MKYPWALLAVIAVVGTACAGNDEPVTTTPAEQTTPEAAFPVTVGSAEAEIEIAAQPQRIVSLSPTATEILFAIDAGDLVVAADAYSTYPDEAPTTELSGFTPNLEAITAYDPDLVVASSDPGDLVSGLDQVSVPTLIHPSAATLDDAYRQIEQLGAATGHLADAAALVAQIQTDLEAVAQQAPDDAAPLTYYHELDPNYYSVSSQTFIGQLYGLLGLQSIADEVGQENGGYPQLSPEFILQADPDVILLADSACCGVDASQVASRPAWDQLTAVQAGRIVSLDEDIASRWGPRIVDFVETLAAELTALGMLELEPTR